MRTLLRLIYAAGLLVALYCVVVAVYLFQVPVLARPAQITLTTTTQLVHLGTQTGASLLEAYWKFACDISPQCRYDGAPGNVTFHVRSQ
jgi:hypothetical protein